MPHSIWETIADTPWWMVVLFILFIQWGIFATKPRVIPMRQLYLWPVLFFLISLGTFIKATPELTHFLQWMTVIVMGTAVGALQFRLIKIKAIKNEEKLYIPGTWSVFLLIFFLPIVKYYYGFPLTMPLAFMLSAQFAGWLSLVYGGLTGFFLGRMLCARRCLKTGPFM